MLTRPFDVSKHVVYWFNRVRLASYQKYAKIRLAGSRIAHMDHARRNRVGGGTHHQIFDTGNLPDVKMHPIGSKDL